MSGDYLNHILAQAAGTADQSGLVNQVIETLTFTGIGIALFAVAFFIVKLICPFSIRKEIEEDQNTALAIVLGSIFIGISLIVMGALMGG